MFKILCCLLFALHMTTNIEAKEQVNIQSEYAIAIHINSGKVVYEKNSNQKMYPASMTKIMTALVVLEEVEDIQKEIQLTPEMFEGLVASGASVAGFKINENVKIIDLLYGDMLPSGADASQALAITISGSEEKFAEKMNAKANQLKMKDTHFVNASGLHDEQHYSTVKDMAMLLKEALKDDDFVALFKADTYVSTPSNVHPNGMLMKSTRLNKLHTIGSDQQYMLGSKTGFTLEGGLCLASSLGIEGANYIVITGKADENLSSAQNFIDTFAIQDYLKETYEYTVVLPSEQPLLAKEVMYGKKDVVNIVSEKEIALLVEKENPNFTLTHEIDDIKAPIEKGEMVGSATLTYQDQEVATYHLYASESIEKDWFQFSIYLFVRYIGWMIVATIIFVYGLRGYNIKKKRAI